MPSNTVTVDVRGTKEFKELKRQVEMFHMLQALTIEKEDWRIMLISTRELTPEEFELPSTWDHD